MKKLFTILCMLSIIVLVSACDNGDDEGSGGGVVHAVSFEVTSGTDKVTCFNADRNTNIGSRHICEWNCATYAHWTNPANWTITFDLAPELTDPTTTADYTYSVSDPLPCK